MKTILRSSRGRTSSQRTPSTESAQECKRGESSAIPPGAAEFYLIRGRVPVIGKVVAEEKIVGRPRAEAAARNLRASGLEVEIQGATVQPS
jgi:hypothetical protein